MRQWVFLGLAGTAALLISLLSGCGEGTGAVQVILSPRSAAESGARWRVDSGGWRKSGAVARHLRPGTHSVAFKAVDGWKAPKTVTVRVDSHGNTFFTRTYTSVIEGEAAIEGENVTEGGNEGSVEGETLTEGETTVEGEMHYEGERLTEGEGTSEGEHGTEGEGTSEGERLTEGELASEGLGEGEGTVAGEGAVEGEPGREGQIEGQVEFEGSSEGTFEGEGLQEGEAPIEGEYLVEVYVDGANTSHVEDGTEAHPFRTLSAGVRAGTAGAHIHVASGLYDDAVVLRPGMTVLGDRGAYHTRMANTGQPSLPVLRILAGCAVYGLTLSGESGTAILIDPDAQAVISNCAIDGFDIGVALSANASVSVVNTTLYENATAIRAENGATLSALKNNILASNGTGVQASAGALNGDGFNNYFANGQDLSGPAKLPGDIAADPGFVAPDNRNFHLTAVSSCRNAGDPATAHLDLDGSRNDLGADGGPHGVRDQLAPYAEISVTPESGIAPLAVMLDGSASGDEWGIASFDWDLDFRDGLQVDLAGATAQHTYTASNEYRITLTVVDNNGYSAQAMTSVQVDPARLPIASAARAPIAGPAPLSVQFQGEGSNPDGGAVQFSWNFDDGQTSTEQSPAHVYENVPPGGYRAVLTVTNERGASTSVMVPITITRNPVLAADTLMPETGGTVTVSDHSGHPLNGASVVIPPGAISEPIAFPICSTETAPADPRGRMGTVLNRVELGVEGMRLSAPAHVSVPLLETLEPGRPVGAFCYDEAQGEWNQEGLSSTRYQDEAGPEIRFDTTHSSLFAVGTLWSVQSLGTLGGSKSYGYAINDSRMVAGYSYVLVSANWRWAYAWDAVNGMRSIGRLGGKHSYAFGLNNAGAVVGCNQMTDVWPGVRHAFLWDPVNDMRDLGNLGGNSTVAQDINASGQVAGYGLNAAGKYRAFICDWDGTRFVMTELPTLGGEQAYAYGINDNGKVVGTAQLPSGSSHAFLWDSISGIQDLGVLGAGAGSTARDINALDQVVGESRVDNGDTHAFLWEQGKGLQDLGTLGGSSSAAYGINQKGQIAGTAQTAFGDWRAFVWDKDQMDDLNALLPSNSVWLVTNAYGINSNGDLIGLGNDRALLLRR